MPSIQEISQLIEAVASLLWPILVLFSVLLFRKQIQEFLGRLRRGKVFGQEIELEAAHEHRQLPSSAIAERMAEELKSDDLHRRLGQIVSRMSEADRSDSLDDIVDVLRNTAEVSAREAFVRVDTRPLLGARGRVWEDPYDAEMTVKDFLNGLWFQMRSYVRTYTYPEGWVLRDYENDRDYAAIGRPWAESQGQREDKRSLREVGIGPGARLSVVPGRNPASALGPR